MQSSITRVSYSTNKSPRTVLGKLEFVALCVGVTGFDYDPESETWLLQTGDGLAYQGGFDEVIKMAHDEISKP